MSDAFTVEAFTLLGVGLAVTGLRTSLRYKQCAGFRGFQADDYLILVAAVVYTVETILAYSVGAWWFGLANNGMTDEQREMLQPNDREFRLRVGGCKTQLAGWSVYTLLLWTLKACMCSFYLRLTAGLEGFRKKIYIGFVLLVSTWLAVFFGILFGCGLPFEKNWQIHPNPGRFCQPAASPINIFMTLILNVLTDFYLMSIPLPLLWKSRVPRMKKAALLFCFSGGLFVTIAGLLRCILMVTDSKNGAQLGGSWAVRETFVAIVTTNMPMLSPVIQAAFTLFPTKVRSWLSGSGSFRRWFSGKNSSQGGGPRTIEMLVPPDAQDGGAAEGQRAREPPSLYHITAFTESEERILGETRQDPLTGAGK